MQLRRVWKGKYGKSNWDFLSRRILVVTRDGACVHENDTCLVKTRTHTTYIVYDRNEFLL